MKIEKSPGRILIEKEGDDPYREIIELDVNSGWLGIRTYRNDLRSQSTPDWELRTGVINHHWREIGHIQFDIFEWLQIAKLINEHLIVSTRENESAFQMHVGDSHDPTLSGDDLRDVYAREFRDSFGELLAEYARQRHIVPAGVPDGAGTDGGPAPDRG
jgi:hypothetical protein